MENSDPLYNRKQGSGKKWVGLIFLLLGIVLLIRSFGGFIPDWITSWPMILIVIGIATGSKNNYKNPGSIILIFLGVVFLAGRIIPGIDLHDFVFPCLIIGLGLYLILGRRKFNKHFIDRGTGRSVHPIKERDDLTWDKRVPNAGEQPVGETGDAVHAGEASNEPPLGSGPASSKSSEKTYNQDYSYDRPAADAYEDYLDTVSIFGGIKKNIVSKNFKGGDIVTIMGGAEINLMQADIHGTIIIEITQVFGGTKLILPPQWKVSSDLAALFGGIEDKRPLVQAINLSEDKAIILRGTSVFGGIDIRSY